ncbi:hypothetical protein D3C75_1303600 [compost metagenome]
MADFCLVVNCLWRKCIHLLGTFVLDVGPAGMARGLVVNVVVEHVAPSRCNEAEQSAFAFARLPVPDIQMPGSMPANE